MPGTPERDPPTLLKLIQLDLELHPPEGAVIALRIEAHPARPQTAQQGFLRRRLPRQDGWKFCWRGCASWWAKGAWVRRN